ncbi:MAG: NAD(+)/NADH kinase [Clostridia bacterium]|nr:NAD(+)/NADH kinase [Clostridia bacterium]
MKVTLQVNMTRANAYNVAVDVCNHLAEIGITTLIDNELSEVFEGIEAIFLDADSCIRECDIVISIGGDGTIIHSAHDAVSYDKPVLGINAGRLGFLAGLEKSELDKLICLKSGEFAVDNRMRLEVSHYEGDELINTYTCLNDVIIGRGASLRLCEIDARSNGKLLYNYLADGVIVATPTGSTAYSLSSGGPVVDTEIESLILTPICSHSLFSRSIIFKPETVIEFSVKNCDNCSPIFSCDGEDGIEITEKTRILVTKSEKYSKIIRIKSDSFSDILNSKLIERYNHQQGE